MLLPVLHSLLLSAAISVFEDPGAGNTLRPEPPTAHGFWRATVRWVFDEEGVPEGAFWHAQADISIKEGDAFMHVEFPPDSDPEFREWDYTPIPPAPLPWDVLAFGTYVLADPASFLFSSEVDPDGPTPPDVIPLDVPSPLGAPGNTLIYEDESTMTVAPLHDFVAVRETYLLLAPDANVDRVELQIYNWVDMELEEADVMSNFATTPIGDYNTIEHVFPAMDMGVRSKYIRGDGIIRTRFVLLETEEGRGEDAATTGAEDTHVYDLDEAIGEGT